MPRRFVRFALFSFGMIVLRGTPAFAQTQAPPQTRVSPAAPAERFWLAGRYDGNRIVVLFDRVKFNGTAPRTARTLPDPATLGFLSQKELTAAYVAQFQKKSGLEHFQVGDQYDVLLGDGRSVTATITTLIGYVSDAEDDDDDPSYIGALARVNEATALVGSRSYYALQRHDAPGAAARRRAEATAASASLSGSAATFASLFEEPPRFDLQAQIAALLTQRMREIMQKSATPERVHAAESVAPTLAVQSFRLADGALRYYARAEWRPPDEADKSSPSSDRTAGNDNVARGKNPRGVNLNPESEGPPAFAIGAWIEPQTNLAAPDAPLPELRILATEQITSPYGFEDELPILLNAVDLGGGRTGIIANIPGPDDDTLGLWEYRDGADLDQMHLFQSIATDE